MQKKKILIVFGTRPEAIKMAPVVIMLRARAELFDVKVCVSAQHRSMLDQVLSLYDIEPDYDLNIMKQGQDLYDITSGVLLGMKTVLTEYRPDLVLVHGDTTTTMSASLAAFYQCIPVGHVEAGLRTNNMYSPYPEEINRQLTSRITRFHFSPTLSSKQNLLQEKIAESDIHITGNTVVDSLHMVLEIIKNNSDLSQRLMNAFTEKLKFNISNARILLVTGHRRENFGAGFQEICAALGQLAVEYPDTQIIYPVHLNPNVKEPVEKELASISNIHLIEPLDYDEFIFLMHHSWVVLTDSGGLQEEAPSLGKPVLVMRDTTERPEAVDAGTVKLVGANAENIVKAMRLMYKDEEYQAMARAHNPYGDGTAAAQIADILQKELYV